MGVNDLLAVIAGLGTADLLEQRRLYRQETAAILLEDAEWRADRSARVHEYRELRAKLMAPYLAQIEPFHQTPPCRRAGAAKVGNLQAHLPYDGLPLMDLLKARMAFGHWDVFCHLCGWTREWTDRHPDLRLLFDEYNGWLMELTSRYGDLIDRMLVLDHSAYLFGSATVDDVYGTELGPKLLSVPRILLHEISRLDELFDTVTQGMGRLGPGVRLTTFTFLLHLPALVAADYARGDWGRYSYALGLSPDRPAYASSRPTFDWASGWHAKVRQSGGESVFPSLLSSFTRITPGSAQVRLGDIAGRLANAPRVCPRCAETIKEAAVVCRFCGHESNATTPA